MLKLLYPAIKLVSGHYRKSPTGRTLWCGPFALAMITGLPYDTVYAKALDVEKRRIRALNRKKSGKPNYPYSIPTSLQGMADAALMRVAAKLGVKVKFNLVGGWGKMTMLTFVREHTVKDRVYVLIASNHYETVCNGILYHSHHDPVPVEEAPKYRMSRVVYWAEVKPLPGAIATDDAVVREAVPSIHRDTRAILPAPAHGPVAVQAA